MDRILHSTPFGRTSGRQLPFSTRLANLADIPLFFRKTVGRLLEGREKNVQHIIFTPEFGTFGEYCPATIFIVTDQEWLAFSAEGSGTPSVCYAEFAQTRLIEFSLMLLQGRIVLEYGEAGEHPCILRFGLASWDLFRDALSLVLSRGTHYAPAEILAHPLPPECDRLSFGMRSTLQESLMPNDKLCEVCSWTRLDAATTTDRLLLHPGGLVLTKNYLCLVTADDPSDRGGASDLSGYNRGVIFMSRGFPIVGRTISHDGIDEIQLTVGREAQESFVNLFVPRASTATIFKMLSQ